MSKIKLKILENTFTHCAYSNNHIPPVSFSEYVEWDRNVSDDEELVFYTDVNIDRPRPGHKRRIAWLIEPYVKQPHRYERLLNNSDDFEYVLVNDKKLLVSRDSRAGLDSASMYTIDRDGKNTTLLIKAKRFKNKPGFEVPSLYGVFPRFPDKVLISLFNSGSRSRDLYWLDINTKRTELVAREPSVPGELVMNWLVDWEGVPRGFATFMEEGPNKGIEETFYKFTSDGYEKVHSCMHQQACFYPSYFDIDNKTVLGVGQAVLPNGKILNETDTNAMWSYDMDSGEYIEMIYHDPDYDLSSPMHGDYSLDMWFSPDGSELYGFSYQGAKTEKIYFDEYFATVNKSLEAAFPGNEVSVFDWSDDLTN